MTTEETTLPGGRKLCPGWTSEFRTRDDGTPNPVACGQSLSRSTRADQSVINAGVEMCQRCRKAKAKYDEENGARQKREQEARTRYEALIDVYVDDLRARIVAEYGENARVAAGAALEQALAVVDALTQRSSYPPYAQRGELGYRHSVFNESEISAPDRLNILRRAAGLPINHPRHRGW